MVLYNAQINAQTRPSLLLSNRIMLINIRRLDGSKEVYTRDSSTLELLLSLIKLFREGDVVLHRHMSDLMQLIRILDCWEN